MSNQHKNPTISFKITDVERKQIKARILASGMMKKNYFVRSCIYNRICVVGKKETIYPLVQTVNALYLQLLEMQKAFTSRYFRYAAFFGSHKGITDRIHQYAYSYYRPAGWCKVSVGRRLL